MRIGIDATCWSNWRGYGRFARSLIRALLEIDAANDYVLFFDSHCADRPTRGRHVLVPTSQPQVEAASAEGRRSIPDLWRMTMAVAREPLDLFFCPSVYSYFPLLGRWPKVITVHDTIAETYPNLIFRTASTRLFWNAKLWLAIRQADRVVTVSDYARRDLSRTFGIAAERIGIIADAPDEIFRPPASTEEARQAVHERHGLAAPYLLYVGGFGPHKNLRALIDSFAVIAGDPRHAAVSLALVGKREGDAFYSTVGDLDRQIDRLGLASRVRFLGFVPDEDLVRLYQAAEALVLPSLKEGFGLPGIEAMSCATPVLATRESALPEVLGDAGILIDPREPRELTAALEAILADPDRRARLRLAARERAGLFGWKRSAEQALAIFAECRGS
jgi:glycosyltransferase involved in cell wall biosynthesis